MNKRNNKESLIQLSVPGDLHRKLKSLAAMFNKSVGGMERQAYIIGAERIIELHFSEQTAKNRTHYILTKKGGVR